MFEPGRILQVGGGAPRSRNASIIDINTVTPQLTALSRSAQLQYRRHWGNATVMADGRVFVSGGSAVNNAATGVAYTSEIFNPATNSWSTGPTATRMRLYHSTSLLLPDATVITMGGGTPGPETNLNAEIYYPPYLFNGDGTAGGPADDHDARRPSPTPAGTLSIQTRTPPRSHGVAGQDRLGDPLRRHGPAVPQPALHPVRRHADGDPADQRQRTPPGYYMIFVLNAAGVPSEAKFVKINVAGTTPPPPTTTTTTTTAAHDHHDHDHAAADDHDDHDDHDDDHLDDVHHINDDDHVTTHDDDAAAPAAPTNLVINGGFENNPLATARRTRVGLQGWTNTAGPIDVFRNVPGFTAAEGSSIIELDSTTAKDRIEQAVATTAGRSYRLSFQHSPRPGVSNPSNKFDVFWNNTKLVTVNRSGSGLSAPSWQTATFTVTGTGNDRISFRETTTTTSGRCSTTFDSSRTQDHTSPREPRTPVRTSPRTPASGSSSAFRWYALFLPPLPRSRTFANWSARRAQVAGGTPSPPRRTPRALRSTATTSARSV